MVPHAHVGYVSFKMSHQNKRFCSPTIYNNHLDLEKGFILNYAP